ncbi:hypothetical protein PtrM4_102870 [Pyrenophora tritici-repentis]|uniref:Integrase catalytic domain-containing protein n=5 Tax=Pyrenophora tritici-repentis TaxID=45151 RepID=A0A834RV27_9PLEO|nr:hypothetical protein PtrM4_102870 [Pyrenophora tritici-repentis]
MDSGTTIHVGNDLGRFTNIRPPMTGDFLWAGNTRVWIKAYGSVTLRVDSADGHRLLYLENVAYCPDLHCSLVSFRILRRQGLWWDTKSDPTILRRSDDSELAVLHEKYGQWILELNDAEARAAFSTQQPTRRTAVRKRAEAIVWHKRLGHPGSDALEHLVNQSEGVKIVGVPTVKCDACGISKSKRMIRRTPRTILEGPGERVAIDFHDYEAESTTKEKSQMLINCRVTGYIWDFYLSDNRTARVILKSLKMFVTFMMNQFGITVKVIETDNEIFSVKPEVARWCRTRGIVLEPSAPDTQAQNGGAERSGGVVKEKGRAMRLDAHLPWDQWPEIARTAVYLHNRTPKYQNRWRSPYEMFFTAIAFQNGVVTSPRKPNLSHLRAYGCKAFAMTDDTKRGKGRLQRFDPKAWIGYLVGYRSTNIFRIWVPSIGKVISTRDVVFDEEVVYSGEHKEVMDNLMHSTTEEIAAWIRTIELPPGPNPTREELGTFYEDETIARAPENGRLEYDEAGRKVVPYPTPPHTPPPAALLAQMLTNVEHPFRDDDTGGYGLQSEETAYGKQGLDTSYGEHGVQTGAQREHGLSAGVPREQCDAGGYGLQSEETAYGKQGLDTSYGEHGVQTGAQREHGLSAGVPREQCDAGGYGLQSEETAYGKQGLDTSYGKQGLASGILHPEHRMLKEPWAAAFMAGTKAGNVQNLAGERLDKAKLERMMRNGKKPHRSQLPPPPQANGLREDHELFYFFKEAEITHLHSHKETRSWSEVPAKTARKTDQQVLDSMWVYTYKFDKHHRFQKCKARLVVRGDQQRNVTAQETYAATLAGRSFRMLVSIAARFDLELKQYDVSNAFVNADIDRTVYMRMPPGYRKQGTILQLNKALYGLRISPLLWQRHFTAFLLEIGFSPVPHEPCCMIRDGVFIFFYVDDIILASSKRHAEVARKVEEELKQRYNLTGGKDLQWFLGVEVIRDREKRKIWLSQKAYVEKIARLATNKDQRHNTPMARVELVAREGLATPGEINLYQRKIGSLLFAAVNTRPDVAFPVSRLARFLTNPGPLHQEAADRVLLYLESTKLLSLSFGGDDQLVVASDASFADNTADRKSSQGYVIKLFGGLIAWRANKQDTITTSTTEAELLALSQVAKESMFVRMLLEELRVELTEKTITIQCDNTQTIRLINEEISQLTTKLRHVDIHNHWLRQEAKRKSIRVVYVPSGEMLADGFTKTLPANNWPQFLTQVGLVEVKERDVEEADPEEILEKMEISLPVPSTEESIKVTLYYKYRQYDDPHATTRKRRTEESSKLIDKMSVLSNRDPTVILTDYTNWAKWYQQLQAECAAYQVWEKVDPKQRGIPLIEPQPPLAPLIGSYQPSTAATNLHVTQYRQAIGDDSAEAPAYVPVRPSDLATNAKTSYKEDIDYYRIQLEEFKILNQRYQQERTGLGKLTEHIRKTVSQHLFYNCCKAGLSHRQWIENLAANVGIDTKEELKRARERYLAAQKPMRLLAQWETWLTEMDHAITEGKALGIPECQDEEFIKEDFVKAVLKPSPEWTTAFMAGGNKDPRVTVRMMIKQFREYASLLHPIKHKVPKAAFVASGPQLNGEDADDAAEKAPGKRGRGKSRKTPGPGKDRKQCKVCDQQHELKDCWYAFPHNAPVWWKPRETLKTMAQHRIDSDTDLEQEIRGAKRAKLGTPQIKKSQSTPVEDTVE